MTKPEVYGAMKDSMTAAGFDEGRCRYTVFDNSSSNSREPYGAINDALARTVEPYLIFCHQDLVFGPDATFERLVRVLTELDDVDPAWAVAGNAGGTRTLQLAMRITDGSAVWRVGRVPRRVQSLDENLLIIKASSGIGCSGDLSGFHLYGTDICLNAEERGRRCYVIDFHIHHLSTGRTCTPEEFEAVRVRFELRWGPRRLCQFVKTCCTTLFLSRSGALRRCFGGPKMRRATVRYPRAFGVLGILVGIFDRRTTDGH
ncbi:MAG TPA: hypothetical protein VK986_02460 [Tepidisphaeraceae bacterium]|nr:hypothetical protein [Tepidisphaeraceae bacterium]